VRLVETGGRGKAGSADLVIVCDLQAYRRGHAHDAEPCHIVGGGPIPVSLARRIGEDAFLKTVLHDGVKIDTIAHFGRKTTAVLRTALLLGAPPVFDGITCSEAGCDRRYHLEFDHIDPVANGGPSAVANIEPLCWPHHRVKTERDRKAGLLRGKPRGPTRGVIEPALR
jgi:5-methylcytosine-specific restriction endonuclease McrA